MGFLENTDQFSGGVTFICPFQITDICLKIETPSKYGIVVIHNERIELFEGTRFELTGDIAGGKCPGINYGLAGIWNSSRYGYTSNRPLILRSGLTNTYFPGPITGFQENPESASLSFTDGDGNEIEAALWFDFRELSGALLGQGYRAVNAQDWGEKTLFAWVPSPASGPEPEYCQNPGGFELKIYDCDDNLVTTRSYQGNLPEVYYNNEYTYDKPEYLTARGFIFGYLEMDKTTEEIEGKPTKCTNIYQVMPFDAFSRPDDYGESPVTRYLIRQYCSPPCSEKHPRIWWCCSEMNCEAPKEECPPNTCYEEIEQGLKYCLDGCCRIIKVIQL